MLHAEQLKELGKLIGNTNNIIPFPKSKRPALAIDFYRGGKRSAFLTADEVGQLFACLQLEIYCRHFIR